MYSKLLPLFVVQAVTRLFNSPRTSGRKLYEDFASWVMYVIGVKWCVEHPHTAGPLGNTKRESQELDLRDTSELLFWGLDGS